MSKDYVAVEKIHTNNFTLAATASQALGFRVRPSHSCFASAASPDRPSHCACHQVIPVSTLSDNYAYLIVDPESGAVAVVDPAEPNKVLKAVAEHKLAPITTVLTTRMRAHCNRRARLTPGAHACCV
jgi:hypothetical protein